MAAPAPAAVVIAPPPPPPPPHAVILNAYPIIWTHSLQHQQHVSLFNVNSTTRVAATATNYTGDEDDLLTHHITPDPTVSRSVFVSAHRDMINHQQHSGVTTIQSFEILLALDAAKLKNPAIAGGRELVADIENVQHDWSLLLFYDQYHVQSLSSSSVFSPPTSDIAIVVNNVDCQFVTSLRERRAVVRFQASITVPLRECYSRTIYPVLIHRHVHPAIDPTPLVALDLRVERRCVRCFANIDTSSTRSVAVPCQWLWNPKTHLALATSPDANANVYRTNATTLLHQLDRLLAHRFRRLERAEQWYDAILDVTTAVPEIIRAYNVELASTRTVLQATGRFSLDYIDSNTQPLSLSTPTPRSVVETGLRNIAAIALSVLPISSKVPYERALLLAQFAVVTNNDNDKMDTLDRDLFQRASTLLLTQWRYFNDLIQSGIDDDDVVAVPITSYHYRHDRRQLGPELTYKARIRVDALKRCKEQLENQPLSTVVNQTLHFSSIVNSSSSRVIASQVLNATIDLNALYIVQRRQLASSALSAAQFYNGSHASRSAAPCLLLIEITETTMDSKPVTVTTDAFASIVPYYMDVVDLSQVTEDYFDRTSPDYSITLQADHNMVERGGFTNAENWTQALGDSSLDPRIYGSGRRLHYQIALSLRSGDIFQFDIIMAMSVDAATTTSVSSSNILFEIQNLLDLLQSRSGGSPIALIERLVQFVQRYNNTVIQQYQQEPQQQQRQH